LTGCKLQVLGNDNAPAASAEDFSTPLEPVEKLPEPDDVGSSESADNFETPLVPEPTQPAPAPVTAIPTLGGSFDQPETERAQRFLRTFTFDAVK